jgi:aarF domain-containing kinase
MTVETSLGLPYNTLFQVFDAFDVNPLASGSIAQVHKATLNGTSVVAKIRHPNVSKLIDMDFRLMRIVAVLVDFLPALSWLHVRETVEQFSHTMAAQSHLGVEAHHLEVLNHNFRNWDHVRFPRPVFATSAVIIETFEPGRIVTTVLDEYDAVASQLYLQEKTSLSRETNRLKESDQESYPQGYQLVPPELAKFIVTTGLSLYLKMLLIGKLSLHS